MIHTTPWEGSPKLWKKRQARLNGCVGLLLDDHAERSRKRIELYLPAAPTWGAEVLNAATQAVAAHGIELVVKVGPPE